MKAVLYSRDNAVAVYDEIKGRYLGLRAGLEEAIRLRLED